MKPEQITALRLIEEFLDTADEETLRYLKSKIDSMPILDPSVEECFPAFRRSLDIAKTKAEVIEELSKDTEGDIREWYEIFNSVHYPEGIPEDEVIN